MSVGPTSVAFRNDRRRLELLPRSKWRLPAPRRNTLPVPVILTRLTTDFLVLMPLGRRIQIRFLYKSAKHITRSGWVLRNMHYSFRASLGSFKQNRFPSPELR